MRFLTKGLVASPPSRTAAQLPVSLQQEGIIMGGCMGEQGVLPAVRATIERVSGGAIAIFGLALALFAYESSRMSAFQNVQAQTTLLDLTPSAAIIFAIVALLIGYEKSILRCESTAIPSRDLPLRRCSPSLRSHSRAMVSSCRKTIGYRFSPVARATFPLSSCLLAGWRQSFPSAHATSASCWRWP